MNIASQDKGLIMDAFLKIITGHRLDFILMVAFAALCWYGAKAGVEKIVEARITRDREIVKTMTDEFHSYAERYYMPTISQIRRIKSLLRASLGDSRDLDT